jgi:TetR/AcrR family tetracycline transcriptional repressor
MLLRKANVVDGALALLDIEGLDGLTMRKLGAALGVRAGALYRHFPSKEALLDAMAERMVEGVADALPPAPWDELLAALAHRFRNALLARRDGARVFAGTFVNQPNSEALGSAAVGALCAAGIPAERAGWIAFAGMYYVLGHTIEEQAQRRLAEYGDGWLSRVARTPPGGPEFATAIESVIAADPAERFAYGLGLFIEGVRHELAAGAPPAPARRRSRARPAAPPTRER